MSDEVEQAIKEIQGELDEQAEDTVESDGFLTSKGKLLSRSEWHAAVLGFAPIGIAYLMPSPLGEFFILAELMMLRTGFNKKMKGEEIDGHLGDVMDEIAYTFAFTFVATILFALTGWGAITSIDLSQLFLTMLGGA